MAGRFSDGGTFQNPGGPPAPKVALTLPVPLPVEIELEELILLGIDCGIEASE
jgi:hypothetical protein